MSREEYRRTPEWRKRAGELLSPWEEHDPGGYPFLVYPECLLCAAWVALRTYVRPEVHRPTYDAVRVLCSRCGPELEERGLFVDVTPLDDLERGTHG